MPDLGWVVPAAIALVIAAVLAVVIVIAVRLTRRSPRARSQADAAVAEATAVLVRVHDAVDELDAAFDGADVPDAVDVPPQLRRGRTAAQRARDRGFVDVSTLRAHIGVAARRRDQARAVRSGLETQLARITVTRTDLAEWVRTNRTPEQLTAAARRRRDEIVRAAGDPEPLLESLRARFDAADWDDAAAAARAAADALDEADAALADRADLETATSALTRAARSLRAVEDDHRAALQAAENAAAEIAAARTELADALETTRARPETCAPDADERLRAASRTLEAAAATSDRRPRHAVATVAHVREVRDAAVGAAVGERRRLEAARTALPGTLACARAALASAEARDEARADGRPTIDDRQRLDEARRHLARARAAADATEALSAARAAWHAVDPGR